MTKEIKIDLHELSMQYMNLMIEKDFNTEEGWRDLLQSQRDYYAKKREKELLYYQGDD